MATETQELTQVQTVLDGLSSPTDEQFIQAVREYSDGALAGAAALLAMAGGGGGGSLPDWWTVDSTPGSESVDFAGSLSVTPDAPAAFGLTFDYSTVDDWIGAILVRVKDVDTLASNAFALRIYNEAETAQTFDLDAWGSAAINESVAGGPGSANWTWYASDATRVFRVDLDQKGLLVGSADDGQLFKQHIQIAAGGSGPPGNDSRVRIYYDDDDATPALVITAKTADGSGASTTIPLTPE